MDIRVYNRFLDLQFEISRYQSLQFERNHHGVGQFELHINRYSHGATHLDKGHLISLGKQQNKVGIILSKEIILDEKGKESESFKLTGYTLDGIMNRRVVVPPRHTSHDRKSGNAETVMKHYVNKHFVNPDDPGRRLDIMEIAPNQSRGEYISWESRWKTPIDEELEKISISTGLGWVVYADFKAKKFIFDVYESRDLTPGNRQGNNPVFFSPEYESIESQSFIDSDQDYKNVAYIGGQGEGVDRKIVTIGEATGWDRIETFVDARDVSNEDEETEEELTDEEVEKLLIERGKKKMRDMQTVFSLEAKISTPITRKSYEDNHEGYRHPAQPVQGQTVKKEVITPFEYEKDFDLGDRVEVRNLSWNLTMDAPITELIEIYEGDGFKLEATFGRSRPTLISKLKDKFDELEGIEKQEAPEQISVRRMNEAKEFAKKEDVYVRVDAQEFANKAEKKANEYTNEKDTQNRSYTKNLVRQTEEEIEDTKRQLEQAQKDLGVADDNIKKALEDINRLDEEIKNLPDAPDGDFEELERKVNEAQELIDSVTEDKDGQTVLKGTLVTNEIIAENTLLTGTFRGPKATIEELTTKDMHALRAIIEDAIVKGRLDANMATMLGLTTEEMIALNAIIQDATIKGTLNTNEAIFQKGMFNEANIVKAIIEKAKIVDADLSGKLNIFRPDGAISMTDGMIRESPAVSGIDPMFMDNARQKDGGLQQEAFTPWAGYYENQVSHLDGRDGFSVDIRDSDYRSSVRIQRYYFVHTARYFVLTYRSVKGAGTLFNGDLHRHLALIYDSDDNKLVDHTVEENTSATVELVADLGTPSFKSKWLDFRVGWASSWGSSNDYIRFRINNVVQTDFL